MASTLLEYLGITSKLEYMDTLTEFLVEGKCKIKDLNGIVFKAAAAGDSVAL